jgi:hypothetical protein
LGAFRRFGLALNARLQFLLAAVYFGSLGSDPAFAQQLPNRVNIDVLVVAPDARSATLLQEWVRAIEQRLSGLAWDRSLGFSREIRVHTGQPLTAMPSRSSIELRWQQRQALQVVVALGTMNGSSVTATARIFLGRLQGDLPQPVIELTQTITQNTLQPSSSFILMVTYYTLAIDASDHRVTACPLLARAKTLGQRLPSAMTSRDTVLTAISRSQRRLCPTGVR